MTTSEPALVFIHGAGSNAGFWQRQRGAFRGAYYLNLPGHDADGRRETADGGQTIPNPQSVEDYADWVARYVERKGLEGVVLNGHSMGGAITLTLALRRPAWLRGIVLMGTGAKLRVLPDLLEKLRGDYEAAVDLIIERSFAPLSNPPTYTQKILRNGARRQALRTPQKVTLADYEACDRFDVLDRVSEIEVPALCIVGALDRMTPPKYSAFLHKEIKGSRLEVIEGAGHMLPMEQPQAYNKKVLEFLAGLADGRRRTEGRRWTTDDPR